MTQGKRGALTRHGIGIAAIEVIDEEGAEALTVRRIAAKLGIQAPSLYTHVSGKDDILDLVTEIMAADMPQFELRPEDWRGCLLNWAHAYRKSFAEHPNAVAIIARRAVTVAESLRGYDDLIAMLTAAGWTPAAALRLVFGIDYVVLGSILAPFSPGFDQSFGDEYPSLRTAVRSTDPATVDLAAFTDTITAYVTGLPDPA